MAGFDSTLGHLNGPDRRVVAGRHAGPADVQTVFDAHNGQDLFSKTLVAALHEMEGRPWADYGRSGKGLTTNSLARLLHRFGIRPRTIRIRPETSKGYRRADFEADFARYVPSDPSQPSQVSTDAEDPAPPYRRSSRSATDDNPREDARNAFVVTPVTDGDGDA